MAYTFRTLAENEFFDPCSLQAGIPFTQQAFYGKWQQTLGRTVERCVVERDGVVVSYFQSIAFPLIHEKTYLYIPYGPVTTDMSAEYLRALKIELSRRARAVRAVFVRIDTTPVIASTVVAEQFHRAPHCTYHSAYFQPRYEWFLDITKSEDALLKEMHEKTRYSVRLADRKEIRTDIVTFGFDAYFESFYALMAGTAERNGFRLHPREYYRTIFDDMSTLPGSYLSVASFEGKILAIDLIIVSGGVANYVFGGSSSEERNRMPTYSAQWKAITYAKMIRCTAYNFGGVAGDDDTYKGWQGLTAFKKKFGGYLVTHAVFYDVVVNPFWYYAYVIRKSIRHMLHK